MKITTKADLNALQQRGEEFLYPTGLRIMVGMATCCMAKGAHKVMAVLAEEIKKRGAKASLVPVGCTGLCHQEPTVEIAQGGSPV